MGGDRGEGTERETKGSLKGNRREGESDLKGELKKIKGNNGKDKTLVHKINQPAGTLCYRSECISREEKARGTDQNRGGIREGEGNGEWGLWWGNGRGMMRV